MARTRGRAAADQPAGTQPVNPPVNTTARTRSRKAASSAQLAAQQAEKRRGLRSDAAASPLQILDKEPRRKRAAPSKKKQEPQPDLEQGVFFQTEESDKSLDAEEPSKTLQAESSPLTSEHLTVKTERQDDQTCCAHEAELTNFKKELPITKAQCDDYKQLYEAEKASNQKLIEDYKQLYEAEKASNQKLIADYKQLYEAEKASNQKLIADHTAVENKLSELKHRADILEKENHRLKAFEPKPKRVKADAAAYDLLRMIEDNREAYENGSTNITESPEQQHEDSDTSNSDDDTDMDDSAAEDEIDAPDAPALTSMPQTPALAASPTAHDLTPAPASASATDPTLQDQTPAPVTNTTAEDQTPRSSWTLSTFFNRLPSFPSLRSPSKKSPTITTPTSAPATAQTAKSPTSPVTGPATTPATASASTPGVALDPEQAQQFADALAAAPSTPTPTSASEYRRRRKQSAAAAKSTQKAKVTRKASSANTPSSTKPKRSRKAAIVAVVANSVKNEPDIQDQDFVKALDWARNATQQLKESDPAGLSAKRKRLEAPTKFGDLKQIPARTPWQAEGSFGLDMIDYDDDDIVPAWMVLQDMIAELEMPPAKKHKSDHNATMDEDITPLNDTKVPALTQSTSRSLIDTHGNSASLKDLHPRPSRTPSPMFDDPTDHTPDNVFAQQPAVDAAEEARLDREWTRKQTLRRKELLACNDPEAHRQVELRHENEDRAEEERRKAAPLWTQQPPPAPTPAHASLPAPLTGIPSVPAIVAETDPVERQRAMALKHTPARASRLREVAVPSPSDAGSPQVLDAEAIPGEGDLGIDGDLLAEADKVFVLPEYQANMASLYAGDLELVVSEEELSDEEL